MDLERWIENTLKIQAIPAPTFHEAERSAYIKHALMRDGIRDVDQDDMANVYARVPGGHASPVIVSAHLDTVFPFETSLESKRTKHQLAGPGIGDNAVALAALVELAHELPSKQLDGDVWLVANVAEEGLGNLQGMLRVVDRFTDCVSAYLVLEGMILGHIFHRGLPVHRYRIRVLTSGGHSWIHAGRPSAIHIMTQINSELLRISLPHCPRTILNIGNIEGGTTVNTIAPSCQVQIDLRSEDPDVLTSLSRQVVHAAQQHERSGVTIEVDRIGERPGGGLPADHPLVMAARQALRRVGEENVQLQIGSTDASLPLSRGIPAVCVGLTRGKNAHSPDELIHIDPMPRGYAALLDLIQASFVLDSSTHP
ncbi:MAG: M20/M25/M40 family metallo-hydrolase [Anaerolineales bacterium]|jgi:acetylornithine deacetylase/succinyl-diaminopimelate desuccinylase-like protein